MKQRLINIIKPVLRIALLLPGFRNKTVLRMDGGICSQMDFYIISKLFEKCGRKLVIDLNWFNEWGKDVDGIMVRNYDLTKMFPNININASASFKWKIMRHIAAYDNGVFSKSIDECASTLPKTIYLKGYYDIPPNVFREMFAACFKYDDADICVMDRMYLNEILRSECPVAVHVRRGDLTVERPTYGKPVTNNYFLDAIRLVCEKFGKCDFFVFSDEPLWCAENMSDVFGNQNVRFMDINGADKGYADMLLMANCNAIIASKGSLGKYAAMLSPNKPLLVVSDDSGEAIWNDRYDNTVTV